MSNYTTIVIRMPQDEQGRKKVQEGLDLLKPFQVGMSMEDEMTILEKIEDHEDFDPQIAVDARAETARLHALAG